MTPPCWILENFYSSLSNRKPSIESNGKSFLSESDAPLALLPAAPEPQEAGHRCVNRGGGALVILKDSVRERSLCPPLSAGGAHDPALLDF